MRIEPTPIPDLVILHLNTHEDARGFFVETWRAEWGREIGLPEPFVQDNHARSEDKGVLRGLHFQKDPHAQSKLIWASRGAIYDVAVDVRKRSPTYGRWHGLVLSEANKLRFFVPRGFAHGYLTLTPGAEVHYKVDNYYNAASEGGLRFDDPDLAIAWPTPPLVLSDKDRQLPLMRAFDSPFTYRPE
jgi:dTDP-4-dehydrorhamnose 3,5-epimerase